jgi:hypothetical protein
MCLEWINILYLHEKKLGQSKGGMYRIINTPEFWMEEWRVVMILIGAGEDHVHSTPPFVETCRREIIMWQRSKSYESNEYITLN